MVELDVHIDRVTNLPPAWQLLPELLNLLGQPNVDSSRIVRLISYDPGLTAAVLRACNNSLLATSCPVETVDEAVQRLGYNQVYCIVAAIGIAGFLPSSRAPGRSDRIQLWEHSVTTAVAAQMLARDLGEDRNFIFTAALLHDVGRMVLCVSLGDKYVELTTQAADRQQRLLEAEQKVLGLDHAQIGGRLLERWKFSPKMIAAVRFHHDPMGAGAYQRVAAQIAYANLIAYLVGYGFGDQPLSQLERSKTLEILQFDGDRLPGYMLETYSAFEAIRGFFKIGL